MNKCIDCGATWLEGQTPPSVCTGPKRVANDKQVGGDHYKQHGETGEQHWDRVARIGLDYMQAMITRYVERCWDKHGIQDLQKAAHFIEKYIEQARSNGREGKLESKEKDMVAQLKRAEEDMSKRLRYLLEHHVTGEDGVFMFPDGISFECKNREADPMQHYSTARFSFEGIKENKVHYRCRVCRMHVHIALHQQPLDVHPVCGSDATPAYVDQG